MSNYSIEYSIVSRGTEKYNNVGYMAITEIKNKNRYILNVDHGIKESKLTSGYLKANEEYTIHNIAFSRFQLISALMFNKHKKEIKDNILILGIGNLGITLLFYLLDKNYKKLTIYVREKNEMIIKLINIVKKEFQIDLNIVTKIEKEEKYNTYIDTTGSSEVIENIFNNINYNSTVVVLSTPRDEKYYISPLLINRYNITIIGGHEFNGVSYQYRQRVFNLLLKNNQNKEYINDFISEYNYSLEVLNRIKTKKDNFIEIFNYKR